MTKIRISFFLKFKKNITKRKTTCLSVLMEDIAEELEAGEHVGGPSDVVERCGYVAIWLHVQQSREPAPLLADRLEHERRQDDVGHQTSTRRFGELKVPLVLVVLLCWRRGRSRSR